MPIMRWLAPIAVAGMLMLGTAGTAAAGPATDQVHGAIDAVLKILGDPELKTHARTVERRRAIRTVANELFDFSEMSRRTLAIHWAARTPAEREEFVGLFADLLEKSYLSTIEEYAGEPILYIGETADGDLALVKTRIVTRRGTNIPIDYRVIQKSQRWRVCDVSIEGVSLVVNYRAQFNTIIARSGYPDLVSKLKAKRDARPGGPETEASEAAAVPSAPLTQPTR
jgi:phospholipid transport system substrate-binding protein